MEILKFSEPPKRSNRSGSAKRSGLMPMVTFGIAVLVLGGMSTTLAGTISLNSSGTVEFGQGVVTTAACDTKINVTPVSSYETSTGFFVNQIVISDIGISGAANDTTTASRAAGCLGKAFTIRAYDSATAINFTNTSGSGSTSGFVLRIPSVIDSATANSGNGGFFTKGATAQSGTTLTETYFTIASVAAPGWTALSSTVGTTANGQITIGGFKLPATVERITLESSS
jgi:hypothetical protein